SRAVTRSSRTRMSPRMPCISPRSSWISPRSSWMAGATRSWDAVFIWSYTPTRAIQKPRSRRVNVHILIQRAPVASAPLVDRHGLLIVAAHDPPVAVRLAADDHHVDVLAPEHRDHLIGRRLQLAGPRLLAERRARVDVVLDQLIVPVLARAHLGRVVEPVDEELLLREAAAVDELTRGDRIEQECGRPVRIHPAQHVRDMLAPVLLAHAQRERGRAHAGEHAHRAVVRREPMLRVERRPR